MDSTDSQDASGEFASNLDDKLREILDYRKGTTDDRIAQIRSAYQEAGYDDTFRKGYQKAIADMRENNGYMTGREWYKRFEVELQPLIDAYKGRGDDAIYNARLQCLRIAKRASGSDT